VSIFSESAFGKMPWEIIASTSWSGCVPDNVFIIQMTDLHFTLNLTYIINLHQPHYHNFKAVRGSLILDPLMFSFGTSWNDFAIVESNSQMKF
jgi:hypothetical protein